MQVGCESVEIDVAPKLEKEASEVGFALVWKVMGWYGKLIAVEGGS